MLIWIAAGLTGVIITFILYCCVRVGAQADREWQEVMERQKQK